MKSFHSIKYAHEELKLWKHTCRTALKKLFISFSVISHGLLGETVASFIIVALEEEHKCPDLCSGHDSGKGSENRVETLAESVSAV